MRTLPAYVSWGAFLRTLDLLGPRVVNRLDAGSFGGFSASTASQMMQALKFLGLVTSDGQATPDLRLMVEHPDSRAAVLSKVLRQAYPELFAPGVSSMSSKAIEALMLRAGLSPATQRKAITFLLNAAAYVHFPIDETPSFDTQVTSEPPQTPKVSAKRSLTVDLVSGGTIEVSVDFDPFRLNRDDREFVFELIDRLRDYRLQRQQGDAKAQTRDDQEVPF